MAILYDIGHSEFLQRNQIGPNETRSMKMAKFNVCFSIKNPLQWFNDTLTYSTQLPYNITGSIVFIRDLLSNMNPIMDPFWITGSIVDDSFVMDINGQQWII